MIVNPQNYATASVLVRHSHAASEWQAPVGSSHCPAIEAFAISSEITVESWSVVRSDATASGFYWRRDKRNDGKKSRNQKTKHQESDSK
jgi:hypothetical protein